MKSSIEVENKVVFAYYNRLTERQKSIYRQSDAIRHITLPIVLELQLFSKNLKNHLQKEDQKETQIVAQRITNNINNQLKAPPITIEILAVRPSDDWGELHGLYLPEDGSSKAKIQLWMRTAKHKKVVAFKSFLRTLLHEICHHIDYEVYNFPETFHTEGFYNRESSLFKQLVPDNN